MGSSVQTEYDWSTTKPSIVVIDAIAALENVEPRNLPTRLETTLFDHIDPEALDALITNDCSTTVSFKILEYDIIVDSHGLRVGRG